MAYTILIPQDIAAEGKAYLQERGYRIKMGSGTTVQAIKKDVVDCEAIVARTAPYPAEVLEAAPKLKVISRCGVGVDNIDLKAAERLGIWVTNAPESNARTVAEAALGFIIMLGRQMTCCEREFRRGNFEIRNQFRGMDLGGKVLGIVGCGRIGRQVARMARLALEMKVLAYDPYLSKDQAPEGVEMVDDWAAIFSRPDFVSLHLPSVGRPLVGLKEFSLMKPSAYFLNLARGDVVFEAELIEALQKKTIAGAALDVFDKEPPDRDNPLFGMENVIVTPHNTGLTTECAMRMAMDAASGVEEILSGKSPRWPVNKPASPR
ncbi:MAG: hydroxyacid dehydrogenase [Deltaproteobacteria bacterium]|nr:hydroxyacid dehydrogenase [Deltaproteobacteria bacterium]